MTPLPRCYILIAYSDTKAEAEQVSRGPARPAPIPKMVFCMYIFCEDVFEQVEVLCIQRNTVEFSAEEAAARAGQLPRPKNLRKHSSDPRELLLRRRLRPRPLFRCTRVWRRAWCAWQKTCPKRPTSHQTRAERAPRRPQAASAGISVADQSVAAGLSTCARRRAVSTWSSPTRRSPPVSGVLLFLMGMPALLCRRMCARSRRSQWMIPSDDALNFTQPTVLQHGGRLNLADFHFGLGRFRHLEPDLPRAPCTPNSRYGRDATLTLSETS